VLFGRGPKISSHPGNEYFRNLSRSSAKNYALAPRRDKNGITLDLVRKIHGLIPRGRFLKRNEETEAWEEVHLNEAIEKASQSLRDAARVYKENEDKSNSDEKLSANCSSNFMPCRITQQKENNIPDVTNHNHFLSSQRNPSAHAKRGRENFADIPVANLKTSELFSKKSRRIPPIDSDLGEFIKNASASPIEPVKEEWIESASNSAVKYVKEKSTEKTSTRPAKFELEEWTETIKKLPAFLKDEDDNCDIHYPSDLDEALEALSENEKESPSTSDNHC